ncbi:MAG: thiamine pyrophosphate-dependent enzyme [Chloroflexota bacterium]
MAPNNQTVQRMNRFELTRLVLGAAGDDVAIVAGIGNTGFDLHAAGHRSRNFYMLGSMGQAVPIGLGLALAQPDLRVIALEGDGSMLMNLSSLVTVGAQRPENLTVVIWDNGQWQITGGQTLATSETCDLATIARGCGIEHSEGPDDPEGFTSAVRFALDAPGPHVIVAKTDDSPPEGRHHDEPVRIKHEFMAAIGVNSPYP